MPQNIPFRSIGDVRNAKGSQDAHSDEPKRVAGGTHVLWQKRVDPPHHTRYDRPMLIDTHAHIADPEFDADREAVIERALAADVRKIILIGTGLDSSRRAVALAEKYPFLWAAVGLHPHDAAQLDDETLQSLAELADHPKVVGWGETGLDFFYKHSTEDAQCRAFVKQIRMAKEKELPLVVHTREAWDKTFEIMIEENIQSHAMKHGVVLHCFTGDRAIAEKAVGLGCTISFSGILTFKKALPIQEAAAAIGLENIVIETDSPYLAPQGFRGKRNEPSFVRGVAEKIAEIKNIPFDTVAQTTSQNAEALFRLSPR